MAAVSCFMRCAEGMVT